MDWPAILGELFNQIQMYARDNYATDKLKWSLERGLGLEYANPMESNPASFSGVYFLYYYCNNKNITYNFNFSNFVDGKIDLSIRIGPSKTVSKFFRFDQVAECFNFAKTAIKICRLCCAVKERGYGNILECEYTEKTQEWYIKFDTHNGKYLLVGFSMDDNLPDEFMKLRSVRKFYSFPDPEIIDIRPCATLTDAYKLMFTSNPPPPAGLGALMRLEQRINRLALDLE